jgi:hypothetical protein
MNKWDGMKVDRAKGQSSGFKYHMANVGGTEEGQGPQPFFLQKSWK